MNEVGTGKSSTRKEREYTQHHRDILDAAEHLFAENGYYQTTMQMIADRAEFSVGYLYKHFSGKEEMYQAMIRYHLEHMDQLVAEIETLNLRPLEELHRIYSETCNHFNHHRGFMRLFYETSGSDFPEHKAGKRKHTEDVRSKLIKAQEAGELKPFDTSLLAAAMMGTTEELFGVLVDRPSANPFDSLPDILFRLLIDPLRI